MTNKINIIDVGSAGPPLHVPGFECNTMSFDPRDGTPALFNLEGPQTLFITRNAYASSLRMPGPGVHDYWCPEIFDIVGTQTVQCQRLDNIPTPDTIHLLKIDTQGTEFEVLTGALQTLKKVLIVLVEVEFVELYMNQHLFADVTGFLAAAGFDFIDFTDSERVRGKRIWADALFAKPNAPAEILTALTPPRTFLSTLHMVNNWLRSNSHWHWDGNRKRPHKRKARL